ncbi:RES domain-containing protein [Listeria booriae]|uniref:RES domain-containing protein n=1 Tax=Listeria booriae TaxID=1552123 RepID=UPI001627BD89|nr:RES domain-containing protein [Listeria booriae]MBC1211713.1 RES family NAD+ phosphorylase [Listeria booriae]MBC6298780.1 RES family NAD+ phosphorylase [Listeria booriae]
MFSELLNIYTPVSKLENYPEEKNNMLKDELVDTWDIFSTDKESAHRLIKAICSEDYAFDSEVFSAPIGIEEFLDGAYLREHSILKGVSWNEFTADIKSKNRFHTEHINKDMLGKYCDIVGLTIKKGEHFFRARIVKDEMFGIDKMGAPPENLATDGRANARGISALYLSNDKTTAIHETRAGARDIIAVATFKLKEDIHVVDFKAINKLSPFSARITDYTELAVNKLHLKEIGEEIAKPLRKNDDTLEYIPTQYISDFIKAQASDAGESKFHGIRYKSTMHSDGLNLAIFDQNLFECINVEEHIIEAIQYSSSRND